MKSHTNTVLIRYPCHTGMKEARVHAKWDPDAQTWVASSDEVPGIAAKADTLEALVSMLQTLVPELLKMTPRL